MERALYRVFTSQLQVYDKELSVYRRVATSSAHYTPRIFYTGACFQLPKTARVFRLAQPTRYNADG